MISFPQPADYQGLGQVHPRRTVPAGRRAKPCVWIWMYSTVHLQFHSIHHNIFFKLAVCLAKSLSFMFKRSWRQYSFRQLLRIFFWRILDYTVISTLHWFFFSYVDSQIYPGILYPHLCLCWNPIVSVWLLRSTSVGLSGQHSHLSYHYIWSPWRKVCFQGRGKIWRLQRGKPREKTRH